MDRVPAGTITLLWHGGRGLIGGSGGADGLSAVPGGYGCGGEGSGGDGGGALNRKTVHPGGNESLS